MGWLDKILGRGKKAAGDMMGDSSKKREGMAQEREGTAEEPSSMPEGMGQGEGESEQREGM